MKKTYGNRANGSRSGKKRRTPSASKPPGGTLEKERIAFLRNHLRRISLYWPHRNAALKMAKVGPSHYLCKACSKVVPRALIRMDHIEPAVPLNGLDNLHDYCVRMFPAVSAFQALCVTCHDTKTATERGQRSAIKRGLQLSIL